MKTRIRNWLASQFSYWGWKISELGGDMVNLSIKLRVCDVCGRSYDSEACWGRKPGEPAPEPKEMPF